MAGGNSFTKNPQEKGGFSQVFNTSEVLKDSQPSKHTSIFEGVLFNNSQEQKKPESIEVPRVDNQVQREITILASQDKQQEAEEIKKLQQEIQSLIPVTEGLTKDVSNVPLINIPEINDYQLNFLQRIKNFITIFRKDASDSNSGLEIHSHRTAKRFGSKAKSGGQKYRDSSEHAIARSAN